MTLRGIIKDKGYKHIDVCEKLDITRRTLINKLNGDSTFTILQRRQLARMLGLKLKELEAILNES